MEKVSGKKFKKFAEDNIFRPLGMNQTLILDQFNEIIPKLAQSYQFKNDNLLKDIKIYDKAVIGAAGIITTLEDIIKYDNNFYDNKLGRGGQHLIKRWLQRRRLNNGQLNTYAYGVTFEEFAGETIVYHTGSISAFKLNYVIFPNKKTGFALFCNHDKTDLLNYSQRIANIILNIPKFDFNFKDYDTKLSVKSLQVTKEKILKKNLKDYEGYYVSKEIKALYDLKFEKGSLKVVFNTLGDLNFKVYQNETFIIQEIPHFNGFFIKEQQQVKGFILNTMKWNNISFVKYQNKPDCF